MAEGEPRWPDFIITGPGRSGTTSLSAYLDQHPDIYMSPNKEPRFFDRTWERTEGDPEARKRALAEYHALFEDAGRGQVLGEASVTYVYSRPALERIREHIPDVRFIVSYRDPIQRAYSLYWLNVAAGREPKSFLEAVRAEIQGEREADSQRRYVRNGRQGTQLARLYDVFGEERVLVLLFEDLKDRPLHVLETIAGFLDVDPGPMTSVDAGRKHNPTAGIPPNRFAHALRSNQLLKGLAQALLPQRVRDILGNKLLLRQRSKPPMDPEARALLEPYFEPEVSQVEHLLGRELPELRKSWRSDGAAERDAEGAQEP